MELAGRQVILFLNTAGRGRLRRVLSMPKRHAGLLGLVIAVDMNGVWLSQATAEESLQAVLVKWEFVDAMVAIIELEQPKGRVGF